MNRVAIIILNWDGIKDTLECLKSLEDQTYKNFLVLVVDNGSIDSSKKELDKYSIEHKGYMEVIYEPKNLGFAGGVNVGIKWAIDHNYMYTALFNNDAVADKHWLSQLVESIEPEEIGISTGLLLHRDGNTIDSSGDWFSSWGLAFPRGRGRKTDEAPERGLVFGASGGSSLYKTTLFKDIGLFDEDFFAYYEDADISFRAQLAGWKVTYNNLAVAYHKQGATSNRIPGFTVYQTFKNMPLLFIKNVPRELVFSVGIRFYLAYLLILLNAIKNGNGLSAIRGVSRSILLTNKKIEERSVIQKKARVPASYIKSIFWDDLPPDQTGLRKLRDLFIRK